MYRAQLHAGVPRRPMKSSMSCEIARLPINPSSRPGSRHLQLQLRNMHLHLLENYFLWRNMHLNVTENILNDVINTCWLLSEWRNMDAFKTRASTESRDRAVTKWRNRAPLKSRGPFKIRAPETGIGFRLNPKRIQSQK